MAQSDLPAASESRLADIPRIAFVTRRFDDLQGLRTVADAVPLVIFAALLHASQSKLKIILACVLAAYFAARMTWIRSGIDAYYARRFGRVDRSTPHLDGTFLFSRATPLGWHDRRGPDADGIFIRIFIIYQGLLNSGSLNSDASPSVFVRIVVTMFMLTTCLPPGAVLIRDWPHRTHWLLPLSVGVVCTLGVGAAATYHEGLVWQVLACLGYGVALAIAGALDHLLLVKSLGGGAGAASKAEHAERI